MAAPEHNNADERPPFTVYSGVQQTGVGLGGTDRPDLLATPNLSTSRTVREDYFGMGRRTALFSISLSRFPAETVRTTAGLELLDAARFAAQDSAISTSR